MGSRQAACRQQGHAWSGWSLWEALWPKLDPHFVEISDKPMEGVVHKRRLRQCQRCGARQAQNGAGEIIDTPTDQD